MNNSLQRRLVTTAMIAVSVLLFLLLLLLNLVHIQTTFRQAERQLDLLVQSEWRAVFDEGKKDPFAEKIKKTKDKETDIPDKRPSAEDSYFMVLLGENGTVLTCYMDAITGVSEDDAVCLTGAEAGKRERVSFGVSVPLG